MNKRQAIKQVEQMGEYEHFVDEPISKKSVLNIIHQIHEPQEVVIPRFIADKIKYCKESSGYSLFHAMDYCFNFKDTAEWLEIGEETFARAWDDGFAREVTDGKTE